MNQMERPLKERIWEFTKDISVKVSKKAEKHWKINTLRVEIASIKHRINVKYKELGRFVFESHKASTLSEESHQEAAATFFDELARLEADIMERETRIENLEAESRNEEAEMTQEEFSESNSDTKTQAEPEPESEASDETATTESNQDATVEDAHDETKPVAEPEAAKTPKGDA